jgi:solute carrier family 25 (adenine nucleotide translocator) protein 4/5/6/31
MVDNIYKNQHKAEKLSFIENFSFAATSAIISKTAVAPIERVKLKLAGPIEPSRWKAAIKSNTIYGIYKEGLSNWRGNIGNCIRYFPTQGLNFAFYYKLRSIFKPYKHDNIYRKLLENFLMGGIAGSMTLSIVYSLDYCRTILANDTKSAKKGGQRLYSGMADAYRQTLAIDGITGLYRGFAISCFGIFIYMGIYFGLYDSFKPLLGADPSFWRILLLGYVSCITAGYMSYPVDTIRRLKMTDLLYEHYNRNSLSIFS